MKILLTASLAMALAACASTPPPPSARLTTYLAHAGAPVPWIHYYGRIYGWESVDPRALALWTQSREAWLLEFDVPCNGLEYAIGIGLTARNGLGQTGQVYAGIDEVYVNDAGAGRITCVIARIRPLDVAALKEEDARRRAQGSSGT